jgi:hypothetical protein
LLAQGSGGRLYEGDLGIFRAVRPARIGLGLVGVRRVVDASDSVAALT